MWGGITCVCVYVCVCVSVCVCVCMGVTGYEENATEVKREWLHTYNC